MTPRLSRWALPATLMIAAFVLSACAGGMSTTPNAQGLNQARIVGASSAERPQLANPNLLPSGSCPKQFTYCVTISKKHGFNLIWCYGPTSNPCGNSDAGKAKWSGVVCLSKTKTCKNPIKQITAKWSGPYNCQSSDDCVGTYELDALKPGPGLKQTGKYLYKQDVHICPKKGADKCEVIPLGINVGP